MKSILTFLVALLLAPLATQAAELKLTALFSDHMVLQCDKPVPIWGWAPAGETVTVEFAGQTQKAIADTNGKWTVKMDPLKASAEPRELKVGGIVIHDVLVGEVWLGSGQSNMAMGV
ncbi:MAG: sialate O-acetylesterase, partial [bacterium]